MNQWSLLPAAASGTDALLLLKMDVVRAGYSIHVTDLVYIWTETMDKRAIMRRALAEDTSIDPTDGPDQLERLLQYLRKILGGEPNTSVEVSKASDEESLTLKLHARLPHPLEPLMWSMSLTRSTQNQLTEELVIPALENLFRQRTAVSSLLATIKQKDAVIKKLCEKAKETGVDLGTPFAGSAPPRSSKALHGNVHSRSMPGFQEFETETWAKALNVSQDTNMRHVFEQLFSKSFEVYIDSPKISSGASWSDLPNNSKDNKSLIPDSQPGDSGPPDSRPPETITSTIDESKQSFLVPQDEALNYSEARTAAHPNLVQPVNLNSEAQHVSTKSDQGASTRQADSGPRRIGRLGGIKRDDAIKSNPEGEDASAALTYANLRAHGLEPLSPTKARSKKLGRIGGLKSSVDEPDPSRDDGAMVIEDLPSRLSSQGNLNSENEERERDVTTKEQEIEMPRSERETSLERADRVRAELKRALEEKKKGTAKKKRKF